MGHLTFISGYPGSRTAWLATALAAAGARAWHESAASAGMLLEVMAARGATVEVSGMLPLFWEELHRLVPEYRRIHIERPKAAALASVQRRHPDAYLGTLFNQIERGIGEWAAAAPALVVAFDELSLPATQAPICATVGIDFDAERWAWLAQLHIQRC